MRHPPKRTAQASKKGSTSFQRNINRRTILLTQKLTEFLSSASPTSSRRLIDAIAIDFGDLWAVGREHSDFLHELLRMKTSHRKTIAGYLILKTTSIFFEMGWHLRSLRTRLPKLLKDLDWSHGIPAHPGLPCSGQRR